MLVLPLFLGRFRFCLFYLIGFGGGFKTSTQNFEIHQLCKCMQIYSKSTKNAKYSSISWPILILFVLSDWAGWGFKTSRYTEFWNSSIMQIYANLFKINKNATALFLGRFWFCLFYLIGLGGGFKTCTQNLINYANLCKFIQNQRKMLQVSFSSISWPILILFVLSDRAWWGLQNFYTELINYANLCKWIQNQWKMLLLYFLADFNSVCFIW